MQFDNVQLEVLHQAVDVEEVAHEGHQAVTWSSESKGQDFSGGTLQVGGRGGSTFASPFVRRSKRKMSKFHVPTLESICCNEKKGRRIRKGA